MKKFMIKLATFAMLMVAVDFTFGCVFTYLQNRAPYGNWQRLRYINCEMQDEVLIMGSSRASHHYVPQIIEDSLGMSCYNCGVDGNGIVMFLGNIKMFTERYTPKIIIYDVSGFDTKPDDHTTYLGWQKAYYDHPGVKEIFLDVDRKEQYKMYSQLYRWNFKFVQLLTDNVAQFVRTEKGYKPLSGVMDYVPGKDKNMITDAAEEYKYDDVKLRYMEEMMQICKDKGIRLIIASSPRYGATTSEEYAPVYAMADKYGFTIIDHYADSKFSADNKYFKDSSHMNKEGAEEFTKLVCSLIK